MCFVVIQFRSTDHICTYATTAQLPCMQNDWITSWDFWWQQNIFSIVFRWKFVGEMGPRVRFRFRCRAKSDWWHWLPLQMSALPRTWTALEVWFYHAQYLEQHIDGLVQECSSTTALVTAVLHWAIDICDWGVRARARVRARKQASSTKAFNGSMKSLHRYKKLDSMVSLNPLFLPLTGKVFNFVCPR